MVANSIRSPGHIDMSQTDFLTKFLNQYEKRDSVKAITEVHQHNVTFDFNPS